MYSVLGIGINGMSTMSFFRSPEKIKWVLDTDLESVVLHDAMIGGFADENIDILADQENVSSEKAIFR